MVDEKKDQLEGEAQADETSEAKITTEEKMTDKTDKKGMKVPGLDGVRDVGKKVPVGPGNFWNNILSTVLLLIFITAAYSYIADSTVEPDELSISEVVSQVQAGEVKEIIGSGLELLKDNQLWTLKKNDKEKSQSIEKVVDSSYDLLFKKGEKQIGQFRFHDELRSNSRELVQSIKELDIETFILSGDQNYKVKKIASELCIAEECAMGECTPEEKEKWVKENNPEGVLMIGDGANDIFAMNQAVLRGAPVSEKKLVERNADFLFWGNSIQGIYSLFQIAKQRRLALTVVFILSIIYNIAAVGLCLFGMMNPLLAAILMPISGIVSTIIIVLMLRNSKN